MGLFTGRKMGRIAHKNQESPLYLERGSSHKAWTGEGPSDQTPGGHSKAWNSVCNGIKLMGSVQ